jgi:hypothetical protein
LNYAPISEYHELKPTSKATGNTIWRLDCHFCCEEERTLL